MDTYLTLSYILPLSESNIQRLSIDHPLIHLGNRFSSLIRIAEAHEAKTLALPECLLTWLSILLLVRTFLTLLFAILLVVFVFIRTLAAIGRHRVAHNLSRCNSSKWCKRFTQLLIVNVVIQILDIQVNTLILRCLLDTSSLMLFTKFFFAFMFLLSPAYIKRLAFEIGVIKRLYGGSSVLVIHEIDKSESSVLSIWIPSKGSRGDLAVLFE